MANAKLTALTEIIDPVGSDLAYVVDDPAGTPASRKSYLSSYNFLPDSWATNYTLSVTVSSNDLTVALRTKTGGNPSLTDAVVAWFSGARRRGTAALSVTKNDGTSWGGAGASEFATLTVPWFVYLIWNTTPATDILDLGFSRIAHGRLYSDFSSTSTAQNYLAHANASDPQSTDECILIGRFEATLSASPNFLWTVPTFTNSNLIQFPIYQSDWHSWTPTFTGFSSAPTNLVSRYRIDRNYILLQQSQGTNGTSNATGFTVTLPFTARTITNGQWGGANYVAADNGSVLTAASRWQILSAGSTMSYYKDMSGAVWTNANGKRAAMNGGYEI